MDKTEKNIGLDFVVCLLTCIIVFISKGLTDQLLSIQDSSALAFYRGAFIFLAPCAIEGIEIVTSKAKKDNRIDAVELIIGLAGIILTGYLLYEVIVEKNILCLDIIKYVLYIYPLKFLIRLMDDLLILIKERKQR